MRARGSSSGFQDLLPHPPYEYLRVRSGIIRIARVEIPGQYQSCMFNKFRGLCKRIASTEGESNKSSRRRTIVCVCIEEFIILAS